MRVGVAVLAACATLFGLAWAQSPRATSASASVGAPPRVEQSSGAPLRATIVGLVQTPDARGYWLVGGDGGIFTFGSAAFYGSTGAIRLNQPIVGMAPTPDGRGYWLVAADGGIFTFGNAGFAGSTGGAPFGGVTVAMASHHPGTGYWTTTSLGRVSNFGDAPSLDRWPTPLLRAAPRRASWRPTSPRHPTSWRPATPTTPVQCACPRSSRPRPMPVPPRGSGR